MVVTKLVNLLKTARPRQWVKNLTLFAALIFTGNIYNYARWITDFGTVCEAVVAFTVIAASIYFLNDVIDIKADQAHPFKRKRPVASGNISKTEAIIVFFLGSTAGLIWSYKLNPLFFAGVLAYWVIQVLYSLVLKNFEVIDVFVIALGFFLRVFAGALLINAHLSIWFLLCVISTSLFLAVGKRRAELAILTEQAEQHRKVMGKYSANILDAYLSMFATAAFLSWALFTFNFYDQGGGYIPQTGVITTLVSRTLTINKWLMATIPIVIFGIMRYIRIIYDGSRAESPERVILSDGPLLFTVLLWVLVVMGVLYGSWF
jgi:4-hydroxybenzoate polyprenyltransferase